MGFTKTFARLGAVGSTARWAAKGYLSVTKTNPSVEFKGLMKYIVVRRYESPIGESYQKPLLDMINKDEIQGLAQLVTAVLMFEAGYSENTSENKLIFQEVIKEELKSLSVPPDLI